MAVEELRRPWRAIAEWGAPVIAAMLIGCASPVAPTAASRPVVRAESGALRGADQSGVEVFRGIPYAAAPVGALRWRAPQPMAVWDGVREALTAGPACPQPPAPQYGEVGATNEDCLYLNVWRPAGAEASSDLPVMVWIHGGAFVIGSGSLPLYDGAALVGRDVILVSINYRLGRLGFLAHPSLSAEQGGASGNYGLLDQIAALRWVERNIAAFGGDPDNVTVFGESSGGLSILALMTSPMAEGLFDKAIVQSGAGLAVFQSLRTGPFSAEAMGSVWTATRGLSGATPAALRSLTTEQVLEGQAIVGPILDGVVLHRSPGDAFRRGEQMRIPLVVGANSYEASLGFLTEAFARGAVGADYDTLLAKYAEREPVEQARLTLIGEIFGVQPARFIAREHSRADAASFLYYFDQVRASQRGSSHGAPHGGELPYIFGTPAHFFTEWPGQASSEWDERDRRMSATIINYWTTFARSGDPNNDAAPAWQAVPPAEVRALHFGDEIEMIEFDALADETEAAVVAASTRGWGP